MLSDGGGIISESGGDYFSELGGEIISESGGRIASEFAAIKPDAPAIRAGSADHTRPRRDAAGSRKAGERPVKVVITRSEVLRATGPTRPKIMGSSVECSTLGVQISSKVG